MCAKILYIERLDDESLAQSIGIATLEINHIVDYAAHIWRYIYVFAENITRQKFAAQGYYHITKKTLKFFLTVKPWCLFVLQHNKENIVVNNSTSRRRTKAINISTSTRNLEKITRDTQLARSIHSLTHRAEPIEFRLLRRILKQLQNIRRLSVCFTDDQLDVTQICKAINQQRRLRSIHLCTENICSNSPLAISLHKIKHACILLRQSESPSIHDIEYAYRSLKLVLLRHDFVEKWILYLQLCPSLTYMSLDYKCFSVYLPSLIRPNLVVLKLKCCGDYFPKLLAPQLALKRLDCINGCANFAILAAQCPHLSVLKMHDVKVYGRVIGLQLTKLTLYNVNKLDDVIVRHMCAQTLSYFEFYTDIDVLLMHEFRDWICNPEFIVGACICIKRKGYVRKHRFNKKILILSLTETIYELFGNTDLDDVYPLLYQIL